MYWGQSQGHADHYDQAGRAHQQRPTVGQECYLPGYESKGRTQSRYDDDRPLKEKTEEKSLSSLVSDFAGNTSLQGLPFVFRSNKLLPKIFWTSIFLFAFAATVFQFYLVLSKFFLRETTTKVVIGYDNLDFPSISFCNLNPIRKSQMHSLAKTNSHVQRLKQFMGQFKPPHEYGIPRRKQPGANQPDNTQSGAGGTDNTETGTSGTGNTQTGTSGTGNTQTGTSGTGNTQTGTSGTGNTQTGTSRTGNAQTGTSGTGNTQTGTSGTGNTQTGTSGTGNTQTGTSGTGNTQTGTSGTGNTQTGTSGTGNTQTGTSGTGNTQTGTSGTGNTQTGTSGTDNMQTGGGQTSDSQPSGAGQSGNQPSGGGQGSGTKRKKRAAEDEPPYEDFDLSEKPGPPPFRGSEVGGWNFTSDRYEQHEDEQTRRLREQRRRHDNAVYGGGAEDPQIMIRDEFHTTLAYIPRKLRSKLGHSLKVMMLDCVFNGLLCQASNFSGFLDPNYGNCFTFNGADRRTSSLRTLSSGVDAGLNLLIYVESREHLAGIAEGTGLRLDIHPFQTMPFLWKTGLSVPVGGQTYIGLSMTNMSRMGSPYHACNTDTAYLKDFNRKYTKEMCINTCHDRLIAKNCSCFRREATELYPPSAVKGTSALRPCDSQNELKCVFGIMSQRNAVLPQCSCLDACTEVHYDLLTSSSVWPDPSLWFPLVDAICRTNNDSCDLLHDVSPMNRWTALKANFLYLRIYYRDLNFQTIMEEAEYDSEQFLSDLGGTAGLYLGASILTLMELIDLCATCCFIGCSGRRGRHRRGRERHAPYRKKEKLQRDWSWRDGAGSTRSPPRDYGDHRDYKWDYQRDYDDRDIRDRRSDRDSFRSEFDLD